jgi:hypothetical protein
MADLKRGKGTTTAMKNWYVVQKRLGILGNGVGSGDNGGTPTVVDFGPDYVEPRDRP